MPLERLNIKINNLNFKNPLIAASGTIGYGKEFEQFCPLNKLGAISVKGTTKEKKLGNPSPRIAETKSGILNSIGLENPGIKTFINHHLPYLLNKGTKIIANIAGSSYFEYEFLVEELDKTKIDLIELNISCPNVKNGGLSFGSNTKDVSKIVSLVRKKTKKPLIVKLSPNVTSIVDIAKAAQASGADFLCLINTVLGMKIDINTKRPILKNNFGGLSGPCILPIAVYSIWKTKKAVSIPIIGCGGICSFKDALEILMAGACLFQVGTVLLSNPLAPIKILEDLNLWLLKNKIKNIKEIVGSLLEWWTFKHKILLN